MRRQKRTRKQQRVDTLHHYQNMEENQPDAKAARDFHRRAYELGAPGYPNYGVNDFLKKVGIDTNRSVDSDND